jgi:hypothetical protein
VTNEQVFEESKALNSIITSVTLGALGEPAEIERLATAHSQKVCSQAAIGLG